MGYRHRSEGRHEFAQPFEGVPATRDAFLPLASQMDQIAAMYLAKGEAAGIEVLTSFEGMTLPIGTGEPPERNTDPGIGPA